MPITTKKYIEAINLNILEMRDNDILGTWAYEKVVSLPDFSNASDLEKLEWVLKEIGVQYSFYENIPSRGNKCIEPWMYHWCEDTRFLRFDRNGKLIK